MNFKKWIIRKKRKDLTDIEAHERAAGYEPEIKQIDGKWAISVQWYKPSNKEGAHVK